MMGPIYHVTTRTAWYAGQKSGEYRAVSLEQEGFIHCSKAEQAMRVANEYYGGLPDLVILRIDPFKLKAEVRCEAGSDKPDELFPHVYGPLNLEAVVAVFDLDAGPDGIFSLPEGMP